MNKFSASAPGKIIISGEHAVVAGAPAIAIPTTKHLNVELFKRDDKKIICNTNAGIELTFSINDLEKYKTNPSNSLNLLICTLKASHKIKKFANGFNLKINSDIPIGCGFGSSAALIVATIKACNKLQQNTMSDNDIIKIATELEHVQHAKSSGIDVKIAHHNSCIYYAAGKTHFRNYKKVDWITINTGNRTCTTATTVCHTQKIFAEQPSILNAFTAICQRIDRALSSGSEDLEPNIYYNQLLLNKIGVTPRPIQQFIQAAHSLGAAVKITGAGAIEGDNAGALIAPWHPGLKSLCAKYKYSLEKL